MSETAVQEEQKAPASLIDLDMIDSSLVEENVEINVDINPMEAPPPVDDGVHRVKLIGATDWKPGDTKPNKQGNSTSYLSTAFQGVVLAEGTKNNNKRVFVNVNTLSFDGKCQMGYILLQIFGGKSNPEAVRRVNELRNYVDLAKAFRNAIAAEPIVKVRTKWTVRYNAGTKEKPDYKVAKSGQNNFPSDGKGGRLHIINVPNVGDLSAKAEVEDYLVD